jgi:hypothetical protein
MHPVNQLKQLREQMVEQLTQIPEYQALKALERFIGELSSIYDLTGASLHNEQIAPKPTPVSLETRQKPEPSSSPRVTPYIPAHRVA